MVSRQKCLVVGIVTAARTAVIAVLLVGITYGQAKKKVPLGNPGSAGDKSTMDQIYRDESHCLTLPEIRGDKDAPISCYCRDAIWQARYVYFAYLLPAKDDNMSGIVLTLQEHARQVCGGQVTTSFTIRPNQRTGSGTGQR